MVGPLPPLAAYVHFPWCVRKCPYCDFNSHPLRDDLPGERYLDVLLRDIEFERPLAGGRRLASVFLGGGTPSLFSPAAIGRLLEALARDPGFEEGAEITLEANPGTVEQARFAGYRTAGVNRLSLGVQSFDDGALVRLGRIHDGAEAVAAFEAARRAGFDNVNLDLMCALPGQEAAGALADLRAALDLAPEHLSLYQLTIEPNTRFAAAPPLLPGHDAAAAMQDALLDELEEAGWRRYEISAHARPGRESRHNLNYWRFGDYLGLGAGAHGKITTPAGVRRYWKLRQPERYMAAAGKAEAVGGRSRPRGDDLRFEFLMNALRLREGFDPADYAERTSLGAANLLESLVPLAGKGWLVLEEGRVRASDRGWRFLDELLQELLPG